MNIQDKPTFTGGTVSKERLNSQEILFRCLNRNDDLFHYTGDLMHIYWSLLDMYTYVAPLLTVDEQKFVNNKCISILKDKGGLNYIQLINLKQAIVRLMYQHGLWMREKRIAVQKNSVWEDSTDESPELNFPELFALDDEGG